ncbi:DUF5130 family protein [Actinoalloteichus spitiensis]|uniref:DUF5130 family protein n=1 Tax=Actinoalloteichus spitiensis TaxID=252394 RepID=UPI0005856F22|nr:DUF5130 family protein [Actinoalloteichus spitiensis]
MGTGDVAQRSAEADAELGYGEARMVTGRVSVAKRILPEESPGPFGHNELARLDEALTLTTRATGLDFSIYLGELGENTRRRAEELHASLGARATDAVLIAVSPAQRVVELVTGEEASRRIPDRSCKLAVMSMVASFKEGDLAGGLLDGLRMLSDQAGVDIQRD